MKNAAINKTKAGELFFHTVGLSPLAGGPRTHTSNALTEQAGQACMMVQAACEGVVNMQNFGHFSRTKLLFSKAYVFLYSKTTTTHALRWWCIKM